MGGGIRAGALARHGHWPRGCHEDGSLFGGKDKTDPPTENTMHRMNACACICVHVLGWGKGAREGPTMRIMLDRTAATAATPMAVRKTGVGICNRRMESVRGVHGGRGSIRTAGA